MKPIIEIDFSKVSGILTDPTVQNNGFEFCSQVDIFSNPGYLQSMPTVSAMAEAASTDDITDNVRWMRYYGGRLYGLGSVGRFYELTNGTTWTRTATDSNTNYGNGLESYGEHLYFASNDYLGRFSRTAKEVYWNYSFQSLTSDTDVHPMKVYAGKLCIGAGRYIATWDNTTFNGTALTLPNGYLVKSLEVYGDRLMIGTRSPSGEKGMLFSWDGDTNHTYEQATEIGEWQISAMSVWEGRLWMTGGDKGRLYVYNGTSIEKVVQLPGDFPPGYYGYIYADAMKVFKGCLVVGVSASGTGTYSGGVYVIGRQTPGDQFSLILGYLVNEGTLNADYFSLYPTGDQLYISRTAGVDATDYYLKKTASSYIETQIFEVKKGNQSRLVKGIGIEAKTLSSGPVNTIIIKYKLDNDTSWTTLDTFTSSNQTTILSLMKRTRKLQLRVELTASTYYTNTPQLSKVLIY